MTASLDDSIPSSAVTTANLDSWDANAAFWDDKLGDRGNDLFQQLILPTFDELVGTHLKKGDRVLDLGTGNGMVARELARDDVVVVATDYSAGQLERARQRTQTAGKNITFRQLDLTKVDDLEQFSKEHEQDNRRVTSQALVNLC